MKTNQVVIDVETGGFIIEKNPIVEIAAIAIDQENNEIDRFEVVIKPIKDKEYNPKATEIHGITRAFQIANGIEPEQACERFKEFIEKHNVDTFIGHNVKFDRNRLQHFLDEFLPGHGIDFEFIFCTIELVRERYSLESYSLDNCCRFFEIPMKRAHRAMNDTEAALELLKKIMS